MKIQVPSVFSVDLRQDEVKLIGIRQLGADLKVTLNYIDSTGVIQAPEILGLPGYRAGIIYVRLDGQKGKVARLDVSGEYQDTAICWFSLDEASLVRGSTDDFIADTNHQALVAWQAGTQAGIKSACDLLNSLPIESTTSLPLLLDHVFFTKAWIAYQQFDFDEARQLIAHLSSVWWQNVDLGVTALWAVGSIFLEQYEAFESDAYLRLALELIETHKGEKPWLRLDETEIRLFSALNLMRLGRNEEGALQLRLGFETADELNSIVLKGKLGNNYAAYLEEYKNDAVADYTDNFEAALTEYQKALAYLVEANESVTRVAILGNLGRMCMNAGEYGQAQRYYQQAVELAKLNHNEVSKGYRYSQLGTLYLRLGDYDRAKHYLEYAHQIRKQANLNIAATADGLRLAALYRLTGSKAGLELVEEMVLYLKNTTPDFKLAIALVELSKTYLFVDRANEALASARQAWSLIHLVMRPDVIVNIHCVLAETLFANGEADAANDIIEKCREPAQTIELCPEVIEYYRLAMQITQDANLRQAITLGEEALMLIESLRGQLEVAKLGPSFSDKTNKVFSELASLYLQKFDTSADEADLYDAVTTMERGRAALLLVQRGQADIYANNEQIRMAKRKVSLLSEKRISSNEASEDKPLLDAYYESLEQLGSLMSDVSDTGEHFDLVDVNNFSHHLQPGSLVIYFMIQEAGSALVCLDRNSCTYYKLPAESVIIDAARNFIESLQEPNSEISPEFCNLIFSAPLQERILAARELITIPHKILQSVPFAALPFNLSGRTVFLNEILAVRYAYSLSSLGLEAKGNSRFDTDLAIFADPVFTSQVDGSGDPLSTSAESLRGWTNTLDRLPWTAEEAKYIQSAYGEQVFSSPNCLIFTGLDANRRNLMRSDVQTARILHIASHGYYATNMSEVVGIALSEIDNDSQSGFVALTDLIDQHFSNELVVISGCETGMGKQNDGEGIMSLSRGFLAQGAGAVIATLWPISDRASALFMKSFYSSLFELGDPALALQVAQQSLLDNPRYQHPFYWAAYMLHTAYLDCRLVFARENGSAHDQ